MIQSYADMNQLVNQYGGRPPSTIEASATLDALRGMLAGQAYRPGDRLPPERELKDRLGVTRTALRKALDALEREGLIWRHVGKGTFVSGPITGSQLNSLSDLSRTVSPLHMMRTRLALEPAIAREAAINASPAGLASIESSRDAARAAQSWDDYEANDDIFHRAIAEATGNTLLLALFDQLNQVRRAVAWDTVVRSSDCPAPDHTSFAEHDAITAAIAARNATAAHTAMSAHLGSVSARLFGDG
ncbi:FadR/GntR family transcriptional regulator [Ovoidimarina sediminis]|uniref:FadR/GntR family transcriptional regulator n=1 Tax=Ovoidimarina sediminis TaxID=3079856 RepID=UPI00290A9323|nr:FCD domain-containing protein [Rhodophyticola sp. MJ-SS7]MDU8944758.1 FCD domain-containing protein [Rhodophyticola sp. MJ-SS7]